MAQISQLFITKKNNGKPIAQHLSLRRSNASEPKNDRLKDLVFAQTVI